MKDMAINIRTLRCLVVDDEPLAAALISSYVRKTAFLELVAEVNSAAEALECLEKNDIDVVFTDIHMPGMSGMQLARMIPEGVRTVFTTAYADHALEGFDAGAVHYLLKPVAYEQFLEAARRAATMFPQSPRFLNVKADYRLLRIPVSEIEYVEGLKDYVKIYRLGEGRPVLTQMSMKAVEEALGSGFARVHRSFIVNMARVRMIEKGNIVMPRGPVPIGDTYRKSLADRL